MSKYAIAELEAERPKAPPKPKLDRSRRGCFTIPMRWIEENPFAARSLFEGMLIVRAEQRFDIDGFEYVAIGDMFEPVPMGEITPTYDVDRGTRRFTRRPF